MNTIYLHRRKMDATILMQLPSGLSFWEIANNRAEWTQGAVLTKTPDDFKLKVSDVTDTETVCTPMTSTSNSNFQEKIVRPKWKGNFLRQLLPYIDESFSSYSPKFMISLENTTKEHISDFITNGASAKLLGPKRCREILQYMMTPMFHCQPAFVEMWSFLLQRPIECLGKTYAFHVNVQEDLEVPLSTITLDVMTKK